MTTSSKATAPSHPVFIIGIIAVIVGGFIMWLNTPIPNADNIAPPELVNLPAIQ